ncbi:hypothetical protein ACRRTK_002212 [Alexandromys fortis]
MAQLYYKKVNYSPYRDRIPLQIVRAETELSAEEKAFLSAVEKGDYGTVKQALQEAEIYYNVNINCVDPLGRNALLIAIENENLEIMELLLNHSVYVGDALLYAIRKEVVGAVELLLSYRKPGREKQVSGQLEYCQCRGQKAEFNSPFNASQFNSIKNDTNNSYLLPNPEVCFEEELRLKYVKDFGKTLNVRLKSVMTIF